MTASRAILALLLWICVIPCSAFVDGRPVVRSLAKKPFDAKPLSSLLQRPQLQVRGGATALQASDYSGAARALFGNVIGPASMLVGGLVPLTFLATSLPGDRPIDKKLRKIYFLVSILSLANEFSAIIYATVASNKLVETVVPETASVFELLRTEYELPWVATNVHFMLGLLGFLSLVMMRAYTLFPAELNVASAGFAGSALLLMFNVVNRGVSEGDAAGRRFGRSMASLVVRYIGLLTKQLVEKGGVALAGSIVLGALSSVLAVHALFTEKGEK